MAEAKRRQLMRLTAEVLRLRLMQANLVATGSKQAMVQRLLDHAEDNTTSDQEEQSDPATPVGPSDSEQQPCHPGRPVGFRAKQSRHPGQAVGLGAGAGA